MPLGGDQLEHEGLVERREILGVEFVQRIE